MQLVCHEVPRQPRKWYGNVTKCHACHAKRSNQTFETSKNDPFCRTYHIGTAIQVSRERLRTVADGCRRLRTVGQRRANTPSTPQTPRVKREPLLRIREKTLIVFRTWPHNHVERHSACGPLVRRCQGVVNVPGALV
jgi:hypothetical protein